MNFKEFKELISSGAEEIALTEDVIISDEDYGESFEINFDVDNLIIDGNSHEFVSHNKVTLNFNARFVVLKNLSFKSEYPGCYVFNFNIGTNLDNVSFDYNCIIYNNGDVDFSNSNVSNLINYGEVDLYKCNLNELHNSGEANLYYCTMQFHDSFINEKKLEIDNSIFFNNGKKYHLKNEGNLKISSSVFKNFKIKGSVAIIQNEKGVIKLSDTTFEESYCRRSGGYAYNEKGYVISNILGYVDAYNCKFINESYREDINGIYNVGASLILDSCEFKGINEKLIHNANKTVVEEKVNEDGDYYDEKIEYSSNVILKNCKYEDYNNIITDNDNILTLDESMPVIKKIKEGKYLSELIHTGHKEIKIDNYFQLENKFSIDVDDLVIDGCGNTIELDIVYIKSDNVTLKNINFINSYDGTIINYGKNLKIINCYFENNCAFNIDGGAIHNRKGTIYIQNTVFKENTADYDGSGGAIANIEGEIILENCEFIGNKSGHDGGGLYNEGGYVEIIDSTFSGNYTRYLGESCLHHGNEICNAAGLINIKNSEVDGEIYNGKTWSFNTYRIYNRYHRPEYDCYNGLIMSNCSFSSILSNYPLFIENCEFGQEAIENYFRLYAPQKEKGYLEDSVEGDGEIYYLSDLNEFIPQKINFKLESYEYCDYLEDLINDNIHEINFKNMEGLDNVDTSDFNFEKELVLDSNILYKSDRNQTIEINADNLIFDGNNHIINGNFQQMFKINADNICFKDITFKNASSYKGSVMDLENKNILFVNCNFEDNLSFKGVLYLNNSNVKMLNCKFINRYADNSCEKSVIYNENSHLSLIDCELRDDSKLKLLNCEFTSNNCLFENNVFVIEDELSDINIMDCKFLNNKKVARLNKSRLNMENSIFKNNRSYDFDEELIRGSNVDALVKNCLFENNTLDHACVMKFLGMSTCIFKDSSFKNNKHKISYLSCPIVNKHNGYPSMIVSYFINCNFEDKGRDWPFKEISNDDFNLISEKIISSEEKNILLDRDYLADEKLDADGLCIDGQMHEITGNLTITGKNVTLKNIKFNDTVKIENNDTATLENCSFERRFKNEIIINKANLTLKNCSFKEEHRILNTGEVTLIDDDGTEVLMDEIIELYEEESVGGLGALFEKPRKKRPKKTNINQDEENANSDFRTLFGQ